MPWRKAKYPGEFPSLGWGLIDFLEDTLVIPDGDRRGEPWRFTDEQVRYVVKLYRVHPRTGGRVYRRGVLVRPKGWGKSPLLAALSIGEAAGPVVFDGWDAAGEPVARARQTPWVQIAAVSEDATDNTYTVLLDMLELGTVADYAPGLDPGLTRTFLPHNGGRIEPVTASAGSREGQRITFAVLDETHLWLRNNGGIRLAATLRRNLAKMNGTSVETTNAPALGDGSVAEATMEAARRGGTTADGLLVDHREAPDVDLTTYRELRAALKVAYGDASWIDLDRIVAEIHDPATTPSDAVRFYLNRPTSDTDKFFDIEQWKDLPRGDVPADGSLITLGFDGARFHDSTGLVATDVATGFQWPVGVWECPLTADGQPLEGWEVPEDEVDAAVEEAFRRWKVWRMYPDPPYWETPVARWQGQYGAQRVVEWHTRRDQQMAFALRAYRLAQAARELSHDGDTVMARHVGNAVKKAARSRDEDGRPLWLIRKDHPTSPRKIDLAMAGCLSWEARSDALAAGAKPGDSYAYSA